MQEEVFIEGGEKDYLVVDDDRAFRKSIVRALENRGNTALDVKSVDEAITFLSTASVKRMIVDLRMPERNGLELVEYCQREQKPIEIVVLTGYGSITTATTAVKLGAVNYLTKPCDIEKILKSFEKTSLKPKSLSKEIAVPSLSQVEWEYIQKVVEECGGNITNAAKLLGLHRRSLQRKLSKSPGTLK